MSDEKTKNSEKREVEWSFDFGNLTDSFKGMFESLSGDEELKTSNFSVEKGGTTRADVDINFSVGTGDLHALNASGNLIEAEIVHVGEVEFNAEGDSVKHIEIRQKNPKPLTGNPLRQGFKALANNRDLRWDVALSPDVPTNLEIHAGVGKINADLTSLKLTGLKIDSGVGSTNLTVPAADAPYTTRIDGGVGQVVLKVPQGASGKIEIKGGVGSVEVFVPYHTAVQINAQQGLGSINVPTHYVRIKDEFMGKKRWQTEGFELADKKLVIQYDGGVGQLRVSVVETV